MKIGPPEILLKHINFIRRRSGDNPSWDTENTRTCCERMSKGLQFGTSRERLAFAVPVMGGC